MKTPKAVGQFLKDWKNRNNEPAEEIIARLKEDISGYKRLVSLAGAKASAHENAEPPQTGEGIIKQIVEALIINEQLSESDSITDIQDKIYATIIGEEEISPLTRRTRRDRGSEGNQHGLQ